MRTALLLPCALLALFGLALTGCSTTGTAAMESDGDPDRIEADDLDGRAISRVEEMLRGQVAGVNVVQTPSGLKIRIRGTSTVYGTSDPLFIVDGLPFELGSDGVLTGLNPRDVDSIEVLKNASETAMYGSRGANGVVLIRTKSSAQPVPETDNEAWG